MRHVEAYSRLAGVYDEIVIDSCHDRWASFLHELWSTDPEGVRSVLDLLFVMKDADGVVTSLKAADIDEEGAAFLSIDVTQPGALGPEDAEEVSDDLPPNSSALLVAFENLWAGKLVDALQAADAVVIDSVRIPADVVSAAIDAS